MRNDDIPCCEFDFWVFIIICLVLVLFAGTTSGLALGLLSFSQVDLQVLVKSGQLQVQKNAEKIMPLVKNEHLLLCTLLIAKSLAIEALPIFLDSILPSWAAILMSVTLVVAFAEIIPQAVCSRYGLNIGARLSCLVRLLLLVFFPISYPISKFLDWVLGKEHSVLLRRAELKTLVNLHSDEAGIGGELSHHEITIIGGALDLTLKTAEDAMTPISEAFALDINSKLDMHTMGLIVRTGHSRIPIYSQSKSNIIGLILVKNLIFCNPKDKTPINHLTLRRIPRVYENWPLYDILNQFLKGHSHMAAVVKKKKKGVKDEANSIVGKPNGCNIINKLKLPPTPLKIKVYVDKSPSCSTDTEYHTPIKNAVEHDKELYRQEKDMKKGDEDTSCISLESLHSDTDEEVVGIITMEDLIEELLQEDIVDETDEYVDVHNKIKVKLLPSRRSSPRRSVSNLSRRSPEQLSPLSSYTSILRSPLAPYTQPPLIRPILYASPGKSFPNSPAPLICSSPFAQRVSRKSYESPERLTNS